jgi:hypothetical protein
MAANSNSCKAFCVTVVSAILVVVAERDKPAQSFLAFIPTVLFFALDTYYLSLEKRFRVAYNDFIEKMHHRELDALHLYAVYPAQRRVSTFVAAAFSPATLPLYGGLALMILLTRYIVAP